MVFALKYVLIDGIYGILWQKIILALNEFI